ncbi:MAG: prolyl oligopeptidase family serine peptidase [Candidatus Latescibacteria bacterium]|nr:prolyl oligopeptidase family serine peptidase [Candidatus Latescibacterota bacterium]NIO56807.1 prolyl oligopeptidase family serine peptidase [Candidatus Latescibacterota bacterium]
MKTLRGVVFFLIAAIGCSLAIAASAQDKKPTLTVERIYADPPLSGELPDRILWLPDSKGISYLIEREIDGEKKTLFAIRDVPFGEEKIICIPDTFAVPEDLKKSDDDKFSFGGYIWSEVGRMIVFRHKGDVFTFDRTTGTLERRTQTEDTETNVTFSPDGSMVAYTRENDLYMMDLDNRERRITTTGADTLLNGILNWVYMEELFTRGNRRAYWWAPNSRAIAFMELNDGSVPEFPLVDLIPTHGSVEMQRYPKAGDPNPRVRVGVYDLESEELYWIDPLAGEDAYIARVYWLSDSKRLAIEKLNRDQNELVLLFADYRAGAWEQILTETDSTWVSVDYMKHYYETKSRFVWTSERDGYAQLYLYNLNGKLIRRLTNGPWEVVALDGVDEKQGDIYYTALEKSLLERHLYKVSEKGKKMRRLTQLSGSHAVRFSPDHRFYIDYFSNTETPTQATVHDAQGKHLFKLWEDPPEELASYDLPAPEIFTMTSVQGISYQCSMIKPTHFDPGKKYPVIIYTYGGPNAQLVRNRWGGSLYLWHAMMAERGYIIFSLDNRGAFGKGRIWENPIYKRLGQLELHDQLAGVDYLKSLPFVDASRIGIWGWSYGGYMTCLALFKTPDVFKAGAAVAPVADFRLYDTIYTERYMKRPEDNEEAYNEGAPINFVENLKGAFLLVHGTADDNVHMQSSIVLAEKLIEAGKDFDLMLYPGKMHGIRGKAARTHLFNKITTFFEENL